MPRVLLHHDPHMLGHHHDSLRLGPRHGPSGAAAEAVPSGAAHVPCTEAEREPAGNALPQQAVQQPAAQRRGPTVTPPLVPAAQHTPGTLPFSRAGALGSSGRRRTLAKVQAHAEGCWERLHEGSFECAHVQMSLGLLSPGLLHGRSGYQASSCQVIHALLTRHDMRSAEIRPSHPVLLTSRSGSPLPQALLCGH